jgi:hypothetical protein
MGARLCTALELQNGYAVPVSPHVCTTQLYQPMWSSTSCGSSKYYTVTRTSKGYATSKCLSATSTTTSYFTCCADTF